MLSIRPNSAQQEGRNLSLVLASYKNLRKTRYNGPSSHCVCLISMMLWTFLKVLDPKSLPLLAIACICRVLCCPWIDCSPHCLLLDLPVDAARRSWEVVINYFSTLFLFLSWHTRSVILHLQSYRLYGLPPSSPCPSFRPACSLWPWAKYPVRPVHISIVTWRDRDLLQLVVQ